MNLKKCKMCQTPLNRETVSQKDPDICFECAEESRQFTPENTGAGDVENAGGEMNQKKSFLDKLKFWK